MGRMKRTNIVLIVLLVSAVSYLFYIHTVNVNRQIEMAYDVPDKYTQTSSDFDLVVMDFNNYKCGLCRKFHPKLKEAIKRDGKIRYISRAVSWGESKWGETLVTSTYAAGEQGKFLEMHNAIYENWPIGDREELFSVASKVGIDTKQLSRDMSRTEIKNWVEANNKYFKEWGINRTPTLFIGKKIYRPKGTNVTVEEILEEFEKAR